MSIVTIDLPGHEPLALNDRRWAALAREGPQPSRSTRLIYAAAHVAMADSYADVTHDLDSPGSPEEIAAHVNWDATMNFRQHLSALGLGIAEAMDTAQRFEIGWTVAEELIRRCGALHPPAGFVAGAGTDHLDCVEGVSDLVDGTVTQCRFIAESGGIPIILPMPWLSINRSSPEVYIDVYGKIIDQVEGPLFLHWLGDMFLPSLAGYFPGDSFREIMRRDTGVVRGAKISLLDMDREIAIRRELLPQDQLLLSGDDYNFGSLIEGSDPVPQRWTSIRGKEVALGDFSHGLLGILDAVAVPAALALRYLADNELDSYRVIMTACENLGRTIFEAPTSSYKVALAFLAWLNGHQENSMLINHLEQCRDQDHLLRVTRLASEAGVIVDAEGAAEKVHSILVS